jgi:hypothetical protein
MPRRSEPIQKRYAREFPHLVKLPGTAVGRRLTEVLEWCRAQLGPSGTPDRPTALWKSFGTTFFFKSEENAAEFKRMLEGLQRPPNLALHARDNRIDPAQQMTRWNAVLKIEQVETVGSDHLPAAPSCPLSVAPCLRPTESRFADSSGRHCRTSRVGRRPFEQDGAAASSGG